MGMRLVVHDSSPAGLESRARALAYWRAAGAPERSPRYYRTRAMIRALYWLTVAACLVILPTVAACHLIALLTR